MKNIFIPLVFILPAYVCCGQVLESFSDSDYSNNPTWTPDDPNNWTVANEQLRSNSAAANSSFYITTPSTIAQNAEWDFYLQLQFNTSSANFVDVYLVSEEADLLSATNHGYFVRIGGTADEISLYKISSGVATPLINGTDGVTNRSNNPLRIKVIRDENNIWSLQYDASGGTAYILEGTAMDNSFLASTFFGIRIQQSTSGFFYKHFFDDFYVGDIQIEKEPPLLTNIKVLSNTQLSLLFNEPLDPSAATNILNYTLPTLNSNPTEAQLQSDGRTVLLTFSEPFTNGIPTVIDISGVQDLAGNRIIPIRQTFVFFISMPVNTKDIIITEIFADPDPKVGLPEAEFVEVFNRTEHPVDINGWKFSDENSVSTLPSKIILPGEYWLICSSTNASLFSPSVNTLGVTNFPTLNNGGESITLKTKEGLLMDSVNYALSWYHDADKQNGGWSLELIDFKNPCGEEDNWTASEDESGGTPGKINSVNANKPDVTGPKLLSISAISSHELLVRFDEKLEKSLDGVAFTIIPHIDLIASTFTSTTLREIKLDLLQDLTHRQLYTLEISNLRDCNGNFIHEDFNQLTFALTEPAEEGDVRINEILFNPRPGGVDFVEIVNVTSKFINLNNWLVANREEENITNQKLITQNDLILSPQQYLVLTSDESIIKSQYPGSLEKTLFRSSLPPLNDDEGSLALISKEGRLLDFYEYKDDFHSPLLKDDEGVSLERISLGDNTLNPDNWKSASSSVGYATPGYRNSNARPENPIDENAIIIEPEIFSPHVPGQDFARITYRFDQSALAANIRIIDHQGRIIKEIANNETLAFEGFFRWDGDRDDGSRARMGYYFVWFETFNLDGTVKTYRKRVVVGR